MDVLCSRERYRLVLAAGLEPGSPGDAAREVRESEAASLDDPAHSVSLLFRRMAALHVDRDALARHDPLLFRELQGMCTLCRDRARCAWDIAHEFDDLAWQNWRDYCPNSTVLKLLGVLQDCSAVVPSTNAAH